MKYLEIRPRLDTGDIVLFSGESFVSKIIKWGTKSNWSHVGMVIKIPVWDFVLLFESTTLNTLLDLTTDRPVKGVQIVPLSHRISTYEGQIGIRLLQIERTKKMLEDLTAFCVEMRGVPYEKNKIELLKAAYDGWLGENKENLSSVACSEVLAAGFKRCRVLNDRQASNERTPEDFSSNALGLPFSEIFMMDKKGP